MENPFPFAEPIVTSRYDLIKQVAEKLNHETKPQPANLIQAMALKYPGELPETFLNGKIQ